MALERFYSGSTATAASVGGTTGNDEAVRTKILSVPNAAKRQRWSPVEMVLPFGFGATHAGSSVRIGGGIGDVHIRSLTFPLLECDGDIQVSLQWRPQRTTLAAAGTRLQLLAGTPTIPATATTVSPFRLALRQEWAGSFLTPGVWDLTLALDGAVTVARGMAVVRYCVRHTT